MSVYYFSVRSRAGEAALYDHYVLQLVLVGLLSSIFSTMALFWKFPVQSTRAKDVSSETKWLLSLRGILVTHDHRLIGDRASTKGDHVFNQIVIVFCFSCFGTVVSSIAKACGLDVYFGLSTTRHVCSGMSHPEGFWIYVVGGSFFALAVAVPGRSVGLATRKTKMAYFYHFFCAGVRWLPISTCMHPYLCRISSLYYKSIALEFSNLHEAKRTGEPGEDIWSNITVEFDRSIRHSSS